MHLGTLEAVAADVEQNMHAWVAKRQGMVLKAAEHLSDTDKEAHLKRHYPLALADYLDALRRAGNLARQTRKGIEDWDTGEPPAVLGLRDIVMSRGLSGLSPDVQGWLNYLAEIDARFMQAMMNVPSPKLLEETRRENTLIVAARGRGKSELMKVLMHHYVVRRTTALVLIDPHGDMARQVSRWPEFSRDPKQMTYIEPGLIDGHTPRLNPLALGRSLTKDLRSTYAQQLARTLTELVPEAELTPNMNLLAVSCVRVLLEHDGSTLRDLFAMLGDKGTPGRDALVQAGRNHPNPALGDFFRGQFDSDSLKPSKAGLRNRLMLLLTSDGFTDMVCANGCFDLEDAIAGRKTIVFNLGPLGPDEAAAVGRLVLMMLWSLGHRRLQDASRERAPVHVFLDEATKFAGKAVGEILSELRKVGVHLTLAQQVGGDGFARDVRERVYSGTAIKFAGANDSGEMAKVLRQKPEMLTKLERGEFWCRWGEGSGLVKVRVRDDLADDKHAMTASQWAALVKSWKGTIYHEPKPPPEPAKRNARPLE
jgi:hypothetical protein